MVAMIGLPTDVNSSYLRGPAKAPRTIRDAIWSEAGNPYTELGLNLKQRGVLRDVGDVDLREDDGDRERIETAIGALLDGGERVLSLGGDHSVTYPIIRAYSARYPGLSIVHFDAHLDLYPEFQGNRYSHACPFARILEEKSVNSLTQIGIRTLSDAQRPVVEKYGVRIFAPWELDAARTSLPDGPVYVTLDMDGLDPAFAPGVSHREPGGLSVREVLEIIKAIPGDVVGADVVEFNPDTDVGGLTAAVAAKFARELIGRLAQTAHE